MLDVLTLYGGVYKIFRLRVDYTNKTTFLVSQKILNQAFMSDATPVKFCAFKSEYIMLVKKANDQTGTHSLFSMETSSDFSYGSLELQEYGITELTGTMTCSPELQSVVVSAKMGEVNAFAVIRGGFEMEERNRIHTVAACPEKSSYVTASPIGGQEGFVFFSGADSAAIRAQSLVGPLFVYKPEKVAKFELVVTAKAKVQEATQKSQLDYAKFDGTVTVKA